MIRWPIVVKDAPPEAQAAAAARKGSRRPGRHSKALVMNYAMLSSAETDSSERASALA